MSGPPTFAVVGRIERPHGTKGELYVRAVTDRPATTFVPGVELEIAGPDGERPDPFFPALTIESARAFRKGFLVHFAGVTDRDAVDLMRERYLLRPFAELEPLDEGELFHHQLLGLDVVLPTGESVGRVRALYPLEPVDLLEVDRGDRTLLIPFARSMVVGWDLDAGRLTIDPPEGLLDL